MERTFWWYNRVLCIKQIKFSSSKLFLISVHPQIINRPFWVVSVNMRVAEQDFVDYSYVKNLTDQSIQSKVLIIKEATKMKEYLYVQLKCLCINLFSTNPTKWSNTLKQFIWKLLTNCLSVFHLFVGLVLEGLNWENTFILPYKLTDLSFWTIFKYTPQIIQKYLKNSSCSSGMPDHDQLKVVVSQIYLPWILSYCKKFKKNY